MKDGQPKTIELSEYKVPAYLIDATDLHAALEEDQSIITAKTSIRRNPASKQEDNELVLNGSTDMETLAVKVDGRELLSNEYFIEDESLTLYDVPTSFELETQVRIKPQENTALEGLYKSGDMFCTQCEAEGFRNITWYMDRPDVMSKFRTTILADKVKYPILLSNGNEVARGDDGENHWVSWEDPFMKPAYLFAMVAGDLQFIEDKFVTMSGREVKLQIFTEAHNIDKVSFSMQALKDSMAWDERTYGREYDLDIFMIVAVESFNMGAMENKGLNIFNTSCVLARPDTTTDAGYQRVEAVVGHEYFHNWSGNRVTCRDWFQLSLKEGFTVLRDQQFSAEMGSETVCRINDVRVLRGSQFPEDAGPMAHPIRPSSYIEINNFYTATVYEKGAEVVRMIRTLLGEERFRLGTDLYFDRHDGQAVTTEDFVRAMEDANDEDLSQFRYWYSQAGTPTLEVKDYYDADSQTYVLNIKQSCPATPEQDDKQPFHMPVSVGLLDAEGQDMTFGCEENDVAHIDDESGYTVVLHLREAEQEFRFNNVKSKPVVSLLRGFSAPVKLDFAVNRDELTFSMQHDADGFNRWEAGQRLAVEIIQEVVGQIQSGREVAVDLRIVSAMEGLLNDVINEAGIDKAMIAEMLLLPSEAYLSELVEIADVDAIHGARNAVRAELATRLKGLFVSIYKLCQSSAAYQPSSAEVARRSLKNVCLGYLLASEDSEYIDLCVTQFESSDNMTDTSAAVRCLINCPGEKAEAARDKALASFYERWHDDALVVDQWFAMQASCTLQGTLKRVEELMQHEAFTMKNPNRMRALVTSFAFQNLTNFHTADGSGYKFLADRVVELNKINPQMAARVLSPLTRWRKYDSDRQDLMKAQLNRILAEEDLSPDVFEIASKSI